NAAPVVPDQHPQFVKTIFDRNFDASRTGMSAGIGDRLAADPVNLIGNYGTHVSRGAFHNHTKVSSSLKPEIQWDLRERLTDVLECVSREPQAANRISSIINYTPHQVDKAYNKGFRRRIVCQMIVGDVQLHRPADHALQKRIVEF